MATIEEIKTDIESATLNLDWYNRYIQVGNDIKEVDRMTYAISERKHKGIKFGPKEDYYKVRLINTSVYKFFSLNKEEMNELQISLETLSSDVRTKIEIKAQEIYQEGVDNGYINEI